MSLILAVSLVLSTIILLIVAITGFGTRSLEYRIFSAVGALAAAGCAYYLLFHFGGGRFYLVQVVVVLPVYAGYRLYKGFRSRKEDRAERQAVKALWKSANEWRETRRF